MWVFDTPWDSRIINTIREDLKIDAFAQAILAQIDPSWASCSQSQQPSTDYWQFKWHDGLVLFKNLYYVPNGPSCLWVIQNCRGTYIARHFGSTKTLDLLQRSFWWPHMQRCLHIIHFESISSKCSRSPVISPLTIIPK